MVCIFAEIIKKNITTYVGNRILAKVINGMTDEYCDNLLLLVIGHEPYNKIKKKILHNQTGEKGQLMLNQTGEGAQSLMNQIGETLQNINPFK
jgi:hypothetical protein